MVGTVVQLFEIMLKDMLNLGGQHWEKHIKSSRKTPGVGKVREHVKTQKQLGLAAAFGHPCKLF